MQGGALGSLPFGHFSLGDDTATMVAAAATAAAAAPNAAVAGHANALPTAASATAGSPNVSFGGSTPATAFPDLMVEVAFATNPGEFPNYTVLAGRLRGFSLSRGRNSELDSFEAGTLSLLLDNRDRALDPTNTASPYYPYVLPMRRVRLTAIYGTTTYRLFTGYIESWPQSWPGFVDAVVDITAADGFKVLALSGVGGTFPEQPTDERIDALLDDVGWPATERNIGQGNSNVQEVLLAQSSALSNIQNTEQVEQGRFFITPDGAARFIGRHAPFLQTAPLYTFGDGGGAELPYKDLVPAFDDNNVWNNVQILREGAEVSQQADDMGSQERFYKRTLRKEGLLITSDSEALAAAQSYVYRYKEPKLRVETISLIPQGLASQGDFRLWPVVLSLDLGDMVDVIRRPPGGGDPIEQQSLIEAIRHTWSIGDNLWVTTYALSSTEDLQFWILETVGFSELEETTIVGF
jgi:hypothetical protein